MAGKNDYIVFFVEGETEKEFYDALMKFYFQHYNPIVKGYKVCNLKGISRFEAKVVPKLKYEVIPWHDVSNIRVVCCYDSDVFELSQKPPTNWQIVKKKVNELGINAFYEVKAKRMIEDWFLKDLNGLCKYLKIEVPKRIEGRDGLEKIKTLFKKGKKPKIYQKGSYSHKFIPCLNFMAIRAAVKLELSSIEAALGVTVE